MGVIPLGLSVHHFVSSVGADVGFAAIVGLAILVLLYFAQARETANLREQAHEAAQRVEQLEARLAQVARRESAPAPAVAAGTAVGGSRIAPAPAVAGMQARATPPGAPAGVAAPALAAATRLIPDPEPVGVPLLAESAADALTSLESGAGALSTVEPARVAAAHAQASPGVAQASLGAAQASPGAAQASPVARAQDGPAARREAGSGATAVASSPYAAPGAVPPATFAGAGNGSGREHRYDGESAGAGAHTAAQRPPVRPISPTPPRRPLPPPEAPRRSRLRLLGALLAGAAAAAVVVLALVHFSNNGSSASVTAGHSTSVQRTAAFNPSSVTVAVLNGTGTPNLARTTASRLAALGYKQGNVADAAAQTYSATLVQYMPRHRADATQVARALKLKPSAVAPIDSSTQAVACPQPNPCTATVVVTTGADLASH